MADGAKAKREATLNEVARLAGVSTATVRRTMLSPDRVAPETRARVVHALAATNYTPDPTAMALASNRSNLVVLLIPGVISPIFSETNYGILRKLSDIGMLGVMCLTSPDPVEMDRIIRSILARRPDALIITTGRFPEAVEARIRASGVTVIQTWDLPDDPFDVAIGFSQVDVGHAVAKLLHERGKRRPLVITTPGPRLEKRFEGFAEACRALGLDPPLREVASTAHGFLNGRERLAATLRSGRRPDAVVCSSDLVAQGVLAEAGVQGLKVPEDLAVVGFGGTDIAAHTVPSLTTVEIASAAIAEAVADVVKKRAKREPLVTTRIDIGFRLIIRDST